MQVQSATPCLNQASWRLQTQPVPMSGPTLIGGASSDQAGNQSKKDQSSNKKLIRHHEFTRKNRARPGQNTKPGKHTHYAERAYENNQLHNVCRMCPGGGFPQDQQQCLRGCHSPNRAIKVTSLRTLPPCRFSDARQKPEQP